MRLGLVELALSERHQPDLEIQELGKPALDEGDTGDRHPLGVGDSDQIVSLSGAGRDEVDLGVSF